MTYTTQNTTHHASGWQHCTECNELNKDRQEQWRTRYYKDHNTGHYLVAIQDEETQHWDWYEISEDREVSIYLETIEKEDKQVIGAVERENVPQAVRDAARERACE